MKQRERIAMPRRIELRETPIKLCHDISRLFGAWMRAEGEMDGVLTQPGARAILSMLAVSNGLCQRDLVKMTHLRPPTVSVILQKMEETGMVERRCDEGDRRITRVHLTDFGRTIDAQMITRIQTGDACALEGLSAEERETLMRLLSRIRENLIANAEKKEEGRE